MNNRYNSLLETRKGINSYRKDGVQGRRYGIGHMERFLCSTGGWQGPPPMLKNIYLPLDKIFMRWSTRKVGWRSQHQDLRLRELEEGKCD